MAKSKNAAAEATLDAAAMWKYLGWTLLAGAWVLVAAALISFDPADRPGHAVAPYDPQVSNWVGQFGAVIAYRVYTMLGPGVWLLMAGAGAWLAATAAGRAVDQVVLRAVGLLLMSVAASAAIGLLGPSLSHNPEGGGGHLAIFINTELTQRFATPGTLVIVVVSFWIGAVLAVDQFVMAVPRGISAASAAVARIKVPAPVLVGAVQSLRLPFWKRGGGAVRGGAAVALRPGAGPGRRRRPKIEGQIDEDAGGLGATEAFVPEEHEQPEPDADDEEVEAGALAQPDDQDDEEVDSGADAPGAYLESKKQFDPDALRAKIRKLPINFAPTLAKTTPVPRELDLSGYQFPGLDILEEPESNFTEEMEKIVRDQAVELESALQQYRIQGEVVGIDSGPVITLFEVRLAPGTKVAALSAVSSDLARSMRAQNIRIVPNTAGRDTVGIEVPNVKKEKVRLKELMNAQSADVQKMRLPMFLGKDASGNPLIADLAAMPHMLIAGTTGSGKSVCMNSIIMSWLLTRRPDELKLVLVDPKMVEMSMFKDIPHLMCPVVTEMGKAAAILEWAVTKMDERYELLAEAAVRDIDSYNGLTWDELKERFSPATEEEEQRIPRKLPRLVFIIDELADLMMTNKEVEGFIVRIAQKARAVGIHLILATQRPQANVVTGLIKSNMPARVAFKVASGMDSRIVLDQKGAELLLGHGDMLFLSPRSSKLTRAQGTLVDDLEVRKTVKFLKEIAQQAFEPQLVQIRGADSASVDEEAAKDPLFEEAVRTVIETKRGSVSLLQRRLTIGYSRASRLIEAMASAGILGDHKNAQAREVTLTLEEWDAMRAQAAADAAAQAATTAPAAEEATAADEEALDLDRDDDDDASVPDEFDDEYKQ